MTNPVRDATQAGPDYRRLIEPDRVHGSLYTDPRIFADELARIWYQTWVYIGHESEVSLDVTGGLFGQAGEPGVRLGGIAATEFLASQPWLGQEPAAPITE